MPQVLPQSIWQLLASAQPPQSMAPMSSVNMPDAQMSSSVQPEVQADVDQAAADMAPDPGPMQPPAPKPQAPAPQVMPSAPSKPGMNYQKQFDDQFSGDMALRREQLQQLKDRLANKEANAPSGIQQLNLKPLAAFADSLTGSKTAGAYDSETPQDKYNASLDKLRAMADKSADSLSNDQLGYLKAKSQEESANNKAAFYQAIAQNRAFSNGLREDVFAQRVGKGLDTDPIIVTATTQNQNLTKGAHTLEKGTITPQLLSEVEMDMASALSGKGAATDHVRKSVEMGSFNRKLAEMKQAVTNKPAGVNMPEYAQYLTAVIERLKEANNMNIKARADQLQSGISNLSSQKAKNVLNDKIKNLTTGQAAGASGSAPDFDNMTNEELQQYLGN